jgi:hypothetical protein
MKKLLLFAMVLCLLAGTDTVFGQDKPFQPPPDPKPLGQEFQYFGFTLSKIVRVDVKLDSETPWLWEFLGTFKDKDGVLKHVNVYLLATKENYSIFTETGELKIHCAPKIWDSQQKRFVDPSENGKGQPIYLIYEWGKTRVNPLPGPNYSTHSKPVN